VDRTTKQPEVIVRRLQRNDKGDWKRVEEKVKEAKILADVLEGLLKDVVKADAKLREALLDAYRVAPEVDCHYMDSPIAPSRQVYALKAYLKKLGWDGIRDMHTLSVNIQDFSAAMKEASSWLLKFKHAKNR
jgi:hypothetical protein